MAFISIVCGGGAVAGPARGNPLLATWNTPEATPPFAHIELADIEPAMLQAMDRHDAEIAAIRDDLEL